MLLMEPFQVTAISSRIIAILYGFLATVLINTCAWAAWLGLWLLHVPSARVGGTLMGRAARPGAPPCARQRRRLHACVQRPELLPDIAAGLQPAGRRLGPHPALPRRPAVGHPHPRPSHAAAPARPWCRLRQPGGGADSQPAGLSHQLC